MANKIQYPILKTSFVKKETPDLPIGARLDWTLKSNGEKDKIGLLESMKVNNLLEKAINLFDVKIYKYDRRRKINFFNSK